MSRRRICKARRVAVLILATLLSAFLQWQPVQRLPTAYTNGNIYTVDERQATAGDQRRPPGLYGGEAGVEAYRSRYQGCRFGWREWPVKAWWRDICTWRLGQQSDESGLLDAQAGILDLVKAAAEQAKPEVDPGPRLDEHRMEDTSYPAKEELDAVAPNNPVFLTRACGHMGWANSKAISSWLGLPDTPNPQGGEYLKNAKRSVYVS